LRLLAQYHFTLFFAKGQVKRKKPPPAAYSIINARPQSAFFSANRRTPLLALLRYFLHDFHSRILNGDMPTIDIRFESIKRSSFDRSVNGKLRFTVEFTKKQAALSFFRSGQLTMQLTRSQKR
jgi:hypothetical protein